MFKHTLLCASALVAFSFGSPAETLRMMTFNVRMPGTGDGPNLWDLRRDMFVETIRSKDPDIFGTQELYQSQGDYVVAKLPEYKWFGISRRGNHQDEHMGIFYRESRLRLVDSGNFWLSETPDQPGSISWNVDLPRMVTWGLFEVKATGRRFYYYNTHLPHRAKDNDARVRCSRLILERIAKLPKDVPVILAGDFNAGTGSEPYKVFENDLKNAWVTAAHHFGPEGTFNGFRGNTTGERIDWIWYRGFAGVLQAETVTLHEAERYPSDHFPVFAIFEF